MPVDKSSDRVRRMFGQIAGRYDFLNHLLSLNIDRYWRRRTVRLVPPDGPLPILDVCTGTGDLALAYDRAAGGRTPIVAADFCHEMLAIGREKARRAGADGRITFVEADAQSLPLPDDAFQIVCVAFGLRNVADTDRGLAEMVTRLLRPAAASPCWNFPRPRASRSRRFMAGIFATCCRGSENSSPQVGRRLRVSARQASASFRKAKRCSNGCAPPASADLRCYPLTFGVATLYVGTKADSS